MSKIKIIEFSILFLILNNFDLVEKKLEELSNIEFHDQKNESFKMTLINLISEGGDIETFNSKIKLDYEKI